MPYPLPEEGPPYTAGLRWFLVAVPDDVAFVRAAMGAYTELASYWKWGHEGREPGRQDAAELWQGAIDATLEALEMGFPDILLSHIDEVEDLLRDLAANACCGGGAPGGGLTQTDWTYTDDMDVPQSVIDAGYATDASDTTGMTAFKCMISHIFVQGQAAHLREFARQFDVAGDLTLGIAGVLALAAVLMIGAASAGLLVVPLLLSPLLLLEVGAGAGIVAGLVELGEVGLEAAAEELENNEDEYACAIFNADGPSAGFDAFKAALDGNGLGEAAALLELLQGRAKLASLYTGRYGDTNIAQEIADREYEPGDFECDCEGGEQLLLEWNFDDSIEGWADGQWDSGNGYPEPGAFYTAGPALRIVQPIEHNLPLSGTVTIKCYAKNYSSIANGTITVNANLDLSAGDLLELQTPQNLGAGWAEYTFGPETFEFSRVDRQLFVEFTCTGVSTQFAYIDNIRIYVDPS